jgi:hypothetical protein
MLLPQTRATDAFRIAERVRDHIARLPIVSPTGERVQVTASIGVAALDAGSSRELTELLAAADAALYRAKASGRDQVQMISTSRGLSAVRPSEDPAADAGFWQGGPHKTVTVSAEAAPADAGAARAGGLHPCGAVQLPVDVADEADGSEESTETTSALAV